MPRIVAAPLRLEPRSLRRPLRDVDGSGRALPDPRPRGTCETIAAAHGFFTVVAATCVLGTQFVLIAGAAFDRGCGSSGIALWASSCTTSSPRVVREQKPSLEDGINGGWLIAIVATQSVSVLGSARPVLGAREPACSFSPCDVPARRDALPVDHFADLLPLHLPRTDDGPADAPLLDQHGGGRDLHAGRLVADARRRPCYC